MIYLMGHIIEKMPCESDVFAVHARGTTVRNAAWFKLQRVVKELACQGEMQLFRAEPDGIVGYDSETIEAAIRMNLEVR